MVRKSRCVKNLSGKEFIRGAKVGDTKKLFIEATIKEAKGPRNKRKRKLFRTRTLIKETVESVIIPRPKGPWTTLKRQGGYDVVNLAA
jgi:hypothetical protein